MAGAVPQPFLEDMGDALAQVALAQVAPAAFLVISPEIDDPWQFEPSAVSAEMLLKTRMAVGISTLVLRVDVSIEMYVAERSTSADWASLLDED
jgi:hypothetical protein